jgi:hypothetical protein
MRIAGHALHLAVIPAKAGIHLAVDSKINMDPRVRGDGGKEKTRAIAKNYGVAKGTY